jgi:hypothetical protein
MAVPGSTVLADQSVRSPVERVAVDGFVQMTGIKQADRNTKDPLFASRGR